MISDFLCSIQRASVTAVILILVLIALPGCGDSIERLIADADKLRQGGDFAAAAIKLNSALLKDRRSIPARLLGARIYVDMSRGDAALGLLTRAQQDGAGEADIAGLRAEAEFVAHHYRDLIDQTTTLPTGITNTQLAVILAARAGALGALGHLPEARATLQQALAADEHSVYARVIAARLALDSNDVNAAREEYAAALVDAPRDQRLRQLHADIAYAAHAYAEAAKIYDEIVVSEPWNQKARGELAATQLAQNNVAAAIGTADKVLKDPHLAAVPKHPILYYIRALASFRQQNYSEAQSNSATVVSLVPEFEPARLMAGVSSFVLHHNEQAYYYLSPYVAANPGDLPARKLLAQVQLELDRAADAVKTLTPIVDKSASDPELLSLLGTASARSGDLAASEHYLKLLLQQRPDDSGLRTELGIADLMIRDPKAAADNLEQAVRAHPDASAPQLPLFVALMQTEDYDKAGAIAKHLIATEQDGPMGHLLAAIVSLSRAKLSESRSQLLRARDIEKGNVSVNTLLAKLSLADGRVEDAAYYFGEIIDAHPNSAATYLALAALYAQARRLDDAETTLRRGVDANPTDAQITVALFRTQLSQGKARDALAAAQQALKNFSREPELLDVVGRAQLALGDTAAALSTFRDLVNLAPDAAWAHTDLAEAYLVQYTPENPQWGAVNEAAQAVKLDPKNDAAKLTLARALIAHGRLSEASKVVDELKTARPNSVSVVELEGELAGKQQRSADAATAFARITAINDIAESQRSAEEAQRLGRADDAIRTLRTAVDTHPEDKETRKMLGDAYAKTGLFEQAITEYSELARREPRNPVMQNNLAWLFARVGRQEEALAHARTAVSLAPRSADFLDTLGTILLNNGSTKDAIAPLTAAWQHSGDRPEIGFHLSQALVATGAKTEAIKLLRQLLAGSDPFGERIKVEQLLQQLGG